MAKIDMINLKKLGQLFNAMPAKITEKLSWLVLPDKISLISFSLLYRNILVRAKLPGNDFYSEWTSLACTFCFPNRGPREI